MYFRNNLVPNLYRLRINMLRTLCNFMADLRMRMKARTLYTYIHIIHKHQTVTSVRHGLSLI